MQCVYKINSNATMLDDSTKSFTRVFDLGSNAENIFTKPEHPGVDLSRAVMVGMELLQTSNSFPYSGALLMSTHAAQTH